MIYDSICCFLFFSSGSESSLASSVFGGDNLDVSLPKKNIRGAFYRCCSLTQARIYLIYLFIN